MVTVDVGFCDMGLALLQIATHRPQAVETFLQPSQPAVRVGQNPTLIYFSVLSVTQVCSVLIGVRCMCKEGRVKQYIYLQIYL